jgi:hypothetical protein
MVRVRSLGIPLIVKGHIMSISVDAAMAIAHGFFSQEVEVVHCKVAPKGLYMLDPDGEYYFAIHDLRVIRLGGTQHVAVSKTTGQVRDCGWVGE